MLWECVLVFKFLELVDNVFFLTSERAIQLDRKSTNKLCCKGVSVYDDASVCCICILCILTYPYSICCLIHLQQQVTHLPPMPWCWV